jgi:hypothetical protein
MTEPTHQQIERARELVDDELGDAHMHPDFTKTIARALAAARDEGWDAAVETTMKIMWDNPWAMGHLRALKRPVTPERSE